jgi:hypothetical protein
MKIIPAQKTTPGSFVPLPWQAFSEFFRLVWVGCVATFGTRRAGTAKQEHEPDREPVEMFHD